MSTEAYEKLRYPIGRFKWDGSLTADERQRDIDTIAQTPALLRQAAVGLGEAQLDTPYRDGGWTVRQLIHHVPDSHLNAYVRFRLALTESEPMVKPYDEAAWATLPDARTAPVAISLDLLDGIHARWALLLRALTPEDFQRQFRHPEYTAPRALDWLLHLYAWHGPHHIAHITALRARLGWE